MPSLVAGIHVFKPLKTWMAGTSPAMTKRVVIPGEPKAREGDPWR
jgi:hypothetical protein